MDGGGSVAIRDALPIPLGSLMVEFLIGGIPLMAEGPAPAEPAVRIALCWAYERWAYESTVPANEATVDVRIRKRASASLSLRETFDMERLHQLKAPQLDVGSRSVPTTKLLFRKRDGSDPSIRDHI
jgi:hypothetical protein